MTKTLEMVFYDSTGKETTLSLLDPRADLTLGEVRTVMEDIVAKNIFTSKNGDLMQFAAVRLRSRDVVTMN